MRVRFYGWVVICEWVRITRKLLALLWVKSIKLMWNLIKLAQPRHLIRMIQVIRKSCLLMRTNKYLRIEGRYRKECRCKWCDWRGKCNEITKSKNCIRLINLIRARALVIKGVRSSSISIFRIGKNNDYCWVRRKSKTFISRLIQSSYSNVVQLKSYKIISQRFQIHMAIWTTMQHFKCKEILKLLTF